MGKLAFVNFVPKFASWEKSQPQGGIANAALDVESHILDSTSVGALHAMACDKGFVVSENELLEYMGGYFLYSGLLPSVENGLVVFSPPPHGFGGVGIGWGDMGGGGSP